MFRHNVSFYPATSYWHSDTVKNALKLGPFDPANGVNYSPPFSANALEKWGARALALLSVHRAALSVGIDTLLLGPDYEQNHLVGLPVISKGYPAPQVIKSAAWRSI